ncbi:hypothetical protein ABZ471_30470 [Streptomyces sp. NPDC005728]|uniref:hypothetical protein n=1 Tax=Streptomyces sp. NPDC005728 TaxID=3157054 RepID=UPI0034099D56
MFHRLRAPAPQSEADTASLVEALLTEQNEDGSAVSAVTDTATSQVVGCAWDLSLRYRIEGRSCLAAA